MSVASLNFIYRTMDWCHDNIVGLSFYFILAVFIIFGVIPWVVGWYHIIK